MNAKRMRRNGISLIEVIACIVIVAAMMAPLAGVIRASNRSIVVAEKRTTAEELVQTSRWLQNTVQDGSILQVQRDAMTLMTAQGIKVEVRIHNRNLVSDDGRTRTLLLEGVTRIEFQPQNQASGSSSLIGIRVQMDKVDPGTGRNVTSNTVIALSPQI